MGRKLEPKYKGPFVVVEVLDKVRYVFREMPGSKGSRTAYTGICPSDKLKPFITRVSDSESSENKNE